MDKLLRLLETHRLLGNDGQTYVVHGYEHQTRLDGMPDFDHQWQSTGLFEYKLANGQRVNVDHTGAMTIAGSGVTLERQPAPQSA